MAEILQSAQQPQWVAFVTNFDKAYRQFTTNYNGLLAQQNYIYYDHPELRAEYDRLVQAGIKNFKTLTDLKQTRDQVVTWLNNISKQLGNITASVGQATAGMNGLGALPAIAVAIGVVSASAAIAAITKWTLDAYNFAQRLKALKEHEAKGMTPDAAANAVNKVLGMPSSGEFLGIPWNMLIFGGIAIAGLFVLPKLLGRGR